MGQQSCCEHMELKSWQFSIEKQNKTCCPLMSRIWLGALHSHFFGLGIYPAS